MFDPRALYEADHSRSMRSLQREYGFAVSQVSPITQYEAINRPYHCDPWSVKGVSMAVSFTMGCLMGGWRPRTLTAIRLKDITLTAKQVYLGAYGSQAVLAPHVSVVFTEEKFDDYQGYRSGTDDPNETEYGDWCVNSVGFWMYRLLCMRGALVGGDPLRHARPGMKLQVRAEAVHGFLFCYCTA